MPVALTRKELSSGWQLKETDSTNKDGWEAVQIVSTVVHLDLPDIKR